VRILVALAREELEVEAAATALAGLAERHELVVTHGQCLEVGHRLELALRNRLPERDVVSVLSQVVIAGESREPSAIAEVRCLRVLVEKGAIVICAGNARAPVVLNADGSLGETEVLVDEDRTVELLARRLDADLVLTASELEGAATLAE